jgi:hypothetical protein
MKNIQICSYKRPGPLQRGDNHKNVKMRWSNLKIFFSITTEPDLAQTILGWRGFKFGQTKGITILQREIIAKEY